MRDLDKALADITTIRTQMAAATAFRGYGPAALAATGGLALVTTVAQSAWLEDSTAEPRAFLAGWIATAVISAGMILAEMRGRSLRHHSGLADAMIWNAIGQFLPAGAAGALIGLVLVVWAPDALWLLPGLWQVLVSLGLFASLRSLPGPVVIAACWYLAAGVFVIASASGGRALSPWTMGLPFAIGQLLLAGILYRAAGGEDA